MSGSQQKNQSIEINCKAYREAVFLIVFENLNIVKNYDKTNSNVFVYSLWENTRGAYFFGKYICRLF